MKSLLFIVALSLLAVGYARDQEEELAIRSRPLNYKGDHVLRRDPRATPTVKF